ncbi:2OG-Fe(II) oxygenase [Brevundimonas sp. NPDC003935]|uniref:2OG-Fe(II) oxygenase n=1 Tax=unclassified Brevundimonas TaxID=2622653 RepID=UPI0025BED4ED|nr:MULTISPECIES: 2OG-Fe(II) oxygenase family protein [unclassified Brevundimonas]
MRANQLGPAFRRFGRIHVPGFLSPEDAVRLHQALATEKLWLRSTMSGRQNVDIPVEAINGMRPEQQAGLMAASHDEAAAVLGQPGSLHYMFDTVRIDTAIVRGDWVNPLYNAFYRFLNGPEFLGFIRDLTGTSEARYVDARATRFLPGHYLTEHDDYQPGRARLFAYVLNLTPHWRSDWGGLLNFIDEDGHLAEAYAPRMNALNLFSVPQNHSVSFVTPFATAPRYSITGWIRADEPSPSKD